jgi:hypothetical protein
MVITVGVLSATEVVANDLVMVGGAATSILPVAAAPEGALLEVTVPELLSRVPGTLLVICTVTVQVAPLAIVAPVMLSELLPAAAVRVGAGGPHAALAVGAGALELKR